jgi:hypothetical protein
MFHPRKSDRETSMQITMSVTPTRDISQKKGFVARKIAAHLDCSSFMFRPLRAKTGTAIKRVRAETTTGSRAAHSKTPNTFMAAAISQ